MDNREIARLLSAPIIIVAFAAVFSLELSAGIVIGIIISVLILMFWPNIIELII